MTNFAIKFAIVVMTVGRPLLTIAFDLGRSVERQSCMWDLSGARLGSRADGQAMDVMDEVKAMLGEVLSLGPRVSSFGRDTHLLGAIPELDSMGVVSLITFMEERFGIQVNDDDIDASTFSTVGALIDFVNVKLAA